MDTVAPTPLLTPERQLTAMHSRPPYGRLRRLVPLTATVVRLWLKWRWLRIQRRRHGVEAMEAATHRFHVEAAEAVVRRAIKQQGLIIKACQFLGSRSDILMDEYVRTLSLVHDRVPPRPWVEMMPIIEEELAGRIEDLYAEFDPDAIAAASLAQVYRARLHDGTPVAVKVQYPHIEDIVRWDLEVISLLARIWARLETVIDFRPIAQEMQRNAPDEVNFIHEGRAAENIAATLTDRDDVVIPRIYWPLTTRRVLTMDYLDGIKITDLPALERAGIDPAQVADTLIDLFNTMILKHGIFHADPHPGNLFVMRPERPGEEAKIGLVDFGLTKAIPDEFRDQLIVLTSAIVAEQPEAVYTTMSDMGFRTRDDDPETYNALGEAFLGDVLRSGQAYADQAMMAEINQRMGRVLRANPLIDVPGDVILIARVMGLLSGLGRSLDSRTDLLKALMPYIDPDAEAV
ncbi:MAG: AarF/UbiB family protein [Chloroflexi bacterium]|nr:AarF/UbiB family protein [Chloroflexota bacterium]MQC17118.1 AarF/ABC1/UbiB kinase family protein [Chloroflexota bacterium]